MTGGGDLDAGEDTGLDNPASDVLDIGRDVDVDDEADDIDDSKDGTGDGEADAPVGNDLALNENDLDPTAGASDTGGAAPTPDGP